MSEGNVNIVSELSPQYFWDTDIKKLDANHSKRLIIERVFSLNFVSLFFGHRKSIDLDLFTNHHFDAGQLLENLQQDYPIQLFFTSVSTIKGSIDKVNVDFIAHRYPNVKPPLTSQGLTIFSEEDILAMKLNAISVSGQRSKDFVEATQPEVDYCKKYH